MQINQVNCKNCGATLQYDLKNRMAKCEYCGSEYFLDNLGRIKEYMVELEIFGERRKFYISNIKVEPIYSEYQIISERTKRIIPSKQEYEITLISY